MCRLLTVMKLYYFEDYKDIYPMLSDKQLTEQLIHDALKEYGVDNAEIYRTEKGKPYCGGDIHFSVSHSDRFFVCLISNTNIGVDIQISKSADINKISKRYFTYEERAYIEQQGEDAFYFIWTRKEAYCKYTGNGLQDILAKQPVINRDDVDFIDFKLEDGLYCSCCFEKK